MSDSNSRLVYSTETGRIDEAKPAPVRPKGDGIVRIQRQTSGRKGKGVCLISYPIFPRCHILSRCGCARL